MTEMNVKRNFCLLAASTAFAGCGLISAAFSPLENAMRPDRSDVYVENLGVPVQTIEFNGTKRHELHERLGEPVSAPQLDLDIEIYASVKYADPIGSKQDVLVPGSGHNLDRVTYDIAVVHFKDDVVTSVDVIERRHDFSEIDGCWDDSYCLNANLHYSYRIDDDVIFPIFVTSHSSAEDPVKKFDPPVVGCSIFVYNEMKGEHDHDKGMRFQLESPGPGRRLFEIGHFVYLTQPSGPVNIRVNPLTRFDPLESVDGGEKTRSWEAEINFNCELGQLYFVNVNYDSGWYLRSSDEFSVKLDDEENGRKIVLNRLRLL